VKKMKKLLVGLMMVAMGLLLISPVASAYTVSVGDQITITQGIGGANNGGAFNINGNLFDTFCVERNEYFTPGGSYYIGSITGGAINGGYNGQNPDPISSQTAYLYYQWAIGVIAHTANNANDLQLAIWSLEGEIDAAHPLTLTNGANNFILSAANANGFYGVQVMNLYGSYTAAAGYSNPKQDQLVYNSVPEPATLILFGLGLIGVAGIRRKFKK
jgi:hypothetical protein